MNLFLICAISVSVLLTFQSWFSLCFVVIFSILLYRRSGYLLVIYALSIGMILILCRYFYTLQGHQLSNLATGIVIDTGKNYLLLRDGFETFYISLRGHAYQIGDFLTISGNASEVDFTSMEEAFDFTRYLNDKGCFLELKEATVINEWLFVLRRKTLVDSLIESYDSNSIFLIQCLLLGEVAQSEFINQMDRMNLVYLCSVSGLHIHFWLFIVEKVFVLKVNEKKAKRIAYLTIIPLWLMNPTSISILRILLLYLVRRGNQICFQERLNYLECLCLTMMIFLFFDPFLINQLGFQLGFGLALYHYFVTPIITRHKRRYQLLIRSLLFYIVLIPYYLIQSYTIPISNLYISLLMIPVINLTFGLIYLNFLFIPTPITINLIARFLLFMTEVIEPFSLEIVIGRLPTIIILFLFILIMFYVYYAEQKIRFMKHSIIAVFIFIITNVFGYYTLMSPDFVAFINVGQGDAILFKEGNTAVLIDTGGSLYVDIATEVLIPYLHHYGISDIDALILTHDDFDHAGAAASLQTHFDVKQVFDENDCPIQVGRIAFENINPFHDGDENRSSLVLYTTFLHHRWLLMGDAPVEVEEQICMNHPSLRADYIKIGHHGSNTSTSSALLEQVKPKEAIISCGKNNLYGHPHKNIIERLSYYQIKIRRTDQEGTIRYTS